MATYSIQYSALICGNISIEAKSRTDAMREFDFISDADLFQNYDEVLEADIHNIVREK